MNPGRLRADARDLIRRYVQCMHAVRRIVGGDPRLLLDAGIAIAGTGLTALAAWGPPGQVGTAIAGPPWLLAVLPLLLGGPLVLRRRAPLAMWLSIWAAIGLQDGITRQPPQGLEFMFVLFIASYSLGANCNLRRSAAGMALTVPLIIVTTRPDGLLTYPQHPSGFSVSLSFFQILPFWVAGIVVRARGQAASLAARNAALQRLAEQAADDERARIARELHDIVAHHLSVIVLQASGTLASGTLASGKSAQTALEKIEHAGRQAVADTRRLLGVLRESGEEASLAPRPGIGELGMLADSVRAAGVPVNLVISGDHAPLPAAVDVSVYRIVQEALTNILKHAGPARADVTVGCAGGEVTIEITDDGTGKSRDGAETDGHGLAGMRERVAIFGGELHAGPSPGGGFAVRARLPLADVPS